MLGCVYIYHVYDIFTYTRRYIYNIIYIYIHVVMMLCAYIYMLYASIYVLYILEQWFIHRVIFFLSLLFFLFSEKAQEDEIGE